MPTCGSVLVLYQTKQGKKPTQHWQTGLTFCLSSELQSSLGYGSLLTDLSFPKPFPAPPFCNTDTTIFWQTTHFKTRLELAPSFFRPSVSKHRFQFWMDPVMNGSLWLQVLTLPVHERITCHLILRRPEELIQHSIRQHAWVLSLEHSLQFQIRAQDTDTSKL